MTTVGILDADLLGRSRHRFPNLACMKLSAYWRAKGCSVQLVKNWADVPSFDRVFMSKVFTDTPVPEDVSTAQNVTAGGTGLFFDKAPALPDEIEHTFPDYHLYDSFVESAGGGQQFKEYTDYSIGFTTRGCFSEVRVLCEPEIQPRFQA